MFLRPHLTACTTKTTEWRKGLIWATGSVTSGEALGISELRCSHLNDRWSFLVPSSYYSTKALRRQHSYSISDKAEFKGRVVTWNTSASRNLKPLTTSKTPQHIGAVANEAHVSQNRSKILWLEEPLCALRKKLC